MLGGPEERDKGDATACGINRHANDETLRIDELMDQKIDGNITIPVGHLVVESRI